MTTSDPLFFTQPSGATFARAARAHRRSRGWTLADIEIQSKGSITAVSMGAYERMTRSLSLEKCIEIADLFGVPLSSMLNADFMSHASHIAAKRWIIDLRALGAYPVKEDDPIWAHVANFTKEIVKRRSDWNGEIISLRSSDIATISLMANDDEEKIKEWILRNASFAR